MIALILRAGSKHRTTYVLHLGMWKEPTGNPSISGACELATVPTGTEVVAGMPCTYKGVVAQMQAQWFTDGPGRWFVFILSRGQTLLEPLQDYGPMGALVVDDPSGEDVCADA